MARDSKISWTDATFNPWVGCTKVSPGCKYCYAERQMTTKDRWANSWGPKGDRVLTAEANWKKPRTWDLEAKATGKRLKVFCGSLCDVFEDRPDLVEPRQRLFELIKQTPSLDWLLLTKRPENIRRLWPFGRQPLWNVWLGTSVENQEMAEERIPHLVNETALIHFLSIEPMLGPVDLDWDIADGPYQAPVLERVQWVIVGGESGPDHRPFDLEWARQIRDQCAEAGTAFFFKQVGGVRHDSGGDLLDGQQYHQFPDRLLEERGIT